MTTIFDENIQKKYSNEIIVKYLGFRTLMALAGGLTINFITIYYLGILNTAEYGILLAISFIFITILEYPSGILTDLIGEKNVLVIGYFLFSLSWIGFYFAERSIDIYIAELISCIGVALNSGTLVTWLVSSYQKVDPKLVNYRKVIGRVNSIFLVISSIIGLLGGIIADIFVIKFVFIIESVFSIFCMFIFIFFMKLSNENQKNKHKEQKNYLKELLDGIKDFTVDKKLQRITFSYVLIQTAYALFFNFFWQPLSYDVSRNFTILSLTGGLGIIVMAGTNWISTSKFNFEKNLWRQTLLFILPFLMIWIVIPLNEIIFYSIALILYQALVGLIFPHFDVCYHKKLTIDNRGKMIGLKNVFRTIVMSFGFGFTGILQYTLNIHFSIAFSISLLIIGSLLIKENTPQINKEYYFQIEKKKKKEKRNLKHEIISSVKTK